MGLFPSANDFKAGKGVEKDAPRKTGVGRFFELVGRDMSGMFLANLLTCLGFLPVICLVYIGFLMNSLPVMVLSAAVGGILAGPVLAGMHDTGSIARIPFPRRCVVYSSSSLRSSAISASYSASWSLRMFSSMWNTRSRSP